MFSKPLSIIELKQLFLEGLLNITSKVSKINDDGVLSGTGFGIAKVAQKAMKEIALVEANIFVDSAYGSNLDLIAARLGIAVRFGASVSSTYLRLVGTPGTLYQAGINICTGNHGINFEFTDNIVIGPHGFTYGKVRATITGSNTNVDALSINKISPVPTGHSYLINEVQADGGMDLESDDLFRQRIKTSINLAATDTISKLEQIFMKINSNILRVFYQGVDENGKNILSLTTSNGIDLTSNELLDLENKVAQYLSIGDLSPYGYNSIGITLRMSYWTYIDIDFRCQLSTGVLGDDVRKDIQVRMSKYLDWTKWNPNQNIAWDILLGIVRNTAGIINVSDTTFYPNVDISVDRTTLPRLRSFIMRDLDGNIITDVSGNLSPVFYPNVKNISFQRTILATI